MCHTTQKIHPKLGLAQVSGATKTKGEGTVGKLEHAVVLRFFGLGLTLSILGCSTDVNQPSRSESGVFNDYYPGTERFGEYGTNQFVSTIQDSLSTFGVDVDAGSYTFGRKKIRQGVRPPANSVRVEEYVNYFDYGYAVPETAPFAVYTDVGPSLFRGDSLHVLRIGIQGREPSAERAPWNLTFLVDVSGSMSSRLEFVKQCLYLLIDKMKTDDMLSVCTYAGTAKTVLHPTGIEDRGREEIKEILAGLTSEGSTAMAAGLNNAYSLNKNRFLENGVNRVIVCSDGDANVGAGTHEEILEQIEEYVNQDIFLSTLGFGTGNYNDQMMEQLADKGNGNYYYLDSKEEADRLFGEELSSVVEVVAQDVKVQVCFNADAVKRYRLIGYENRAIEDNAFGHDTTDGGEIGSGHSVTALYELEMIPNGASQVGRVVLKYVDSVSGNSGTLVEFLGLQSGAGSDRFYFAQAVGEYAEILRESPHVRSSLSEVRDALWEYHVPGREKEIELIDLCESMVGR